MLKLCKSIDVTLQFVWPLLRCTVTSCSVICSCKSSQLDAATILNTMACCMLFALSLKKKACWHFGKGIIRPSCCLLCMVSCRLEHIQFCIQSLAQQQQQLFYGSLSGITWVCWYKKGKTNLDLLEQDTVSGSGISWAMCTSAPCFRQTASTTLFFTGQMPFLPPNQQHHWRTALHSVSKKFFVPINVIL